MAMVAARTVSSGARVEIWDDFAATPGTPEYEAIAEAQQEAAARILRRAARSRMEMAGYDLGVEPRVPLITFDDCGCRIRGV